MSKAEGEKIVIKFTQPLIGDVTGNENAFTVSGQEYQWTDGTDNNGQLINKTYQVEKVERYPVSVLYEDNFTNGMSDGIVVGLNGLILGRE